MYDHLGQNGPPCRVWFDERTLERLRGVHQPGAGVQRDFIKSFLEVGVQLTQTLDIEQVLTSIVERSIQLTEARYGAAVTLTEDGVARLPHYPEGKGLLGLVLTDRANVRVDAISEHSASVGFPDEHVPM